MKLTIVNKIDGRVKTFIDRPSSMQDVDEMLHENKIDTDEWDYVLHKKSKTYRYDEDNWEWVVI